MDEEGPKIVVFVGRTAGGFLRFLEKNNLNPIEPELLAEYVRRSIINFENNDMKASNRLLNEIWDIVGVQDQALSIQVASQFGKLCDTYKTLLQTLTGDAKLGEALKGNVDEKT